MATVVELKEIAVEAPLVDGSKAWTRRLCLFSAPEVAACWLKSAVEAGSVGGDETDYALLYYTADEIVLDRRERICRSVVYNRDASVRGIIPGGSTRLWAGRDPATCKFRSGDLVGFVDGARYRVGVVNGLPPSSEEARRWSDVTRGDDIYLVGVLDAAGSPETNDHEHVAEAELFAVEHEVSPELGAALRKRHEGCGT